MSEFERALHECLEALHSGLWDVEECLWRYPEHAAALRPLLLVSAATAEAFTAVEPRAEWASSARGRFLIATGQRLQEAMDVEPEPTFFAAARVRFQLAAQRMRLGQRAQAAAAKPVRVLGVPVRALAGGMAALVVLFSFSTYTVASADNSLPGDWQYGVKLQTERVRLALAFDEDAERSVKLDIAEERVDEIERLASKGKIIGPGVLDRLVDQTQPLVEDVQSGDWDASQASRLKDLSQKQKQVLQDAQPQVAADAQPKLAEASAISDEGVKVASEVIFSEPGRPPTRVPAEVELTPTPAPTEATDETPEPTADANETPGASATPDLSTTTPVVGDGQIIIGSTPAVERNNVKLYPLQVGNLKLLVPGADSGWFLDSTQDRVSPMLLRYSKVDASSFIVINKTNGDMYWYVLHDGRYDEVQMRLTGNDGTVRIVDRAIIQTAYGVAADIPLFILESIESMPPSTATPEPSSTPEAAPTPSN